MLDSRNQALINRENNSLRVILWVAVSVILSSCQPTPDGVCKELSSSRDGLRWVQASLEPQSVVDTKVGRRLASVTGMKPESPTAEITNDWMKWAEKELKRAQWARDGLEIDRQGRKGLPHLNDASLSLVSFHGFIVQKKWRKAYRELAKIETNLDKVATTACAGR